MQAALTIAGDGVCQARDSGLRRAAEEIDPMAYHEVALALVAVDVPVSHARRLGHAIRDARGEDCYRYFMGEYADLVWKSIRDDLNKGRSEI